MKLIKIKKNPEILSILIKLMIIEILLEGNEKDTLSFVAEINPL